MKLELVVKDFWEVRHNEADKDAWQIYNAWLAVIERAIIEEVKKFPDLLLGDQEFHVHPAPFTVLHTDPATFPPEPEVGSWVTGEVTREEYEAAWVPYTEASEAWGGANILYSLGVYCEMVKGKPFTMWGWWCDDGGGNGALGVLDPASQPEDPELSVLFS